MSLTIDVFGDAVRVKAAPGATPPAKPAAAPKPAPAPAAVKRPTPPANPEPKTPRQETTPVAEHLARGLRMVTHVARAIGNAADKEFEESQHPRADDGKFSSSGGASAKQLHPTAGEGKNRTTASGEALPAHVVALKIPPAWTDVHYSPDPKAPLQAVGKDAKGRPVSIYTKEFEASQAAIKFARITELDRKFDRIREQNDAARENPRTRDVADVAHLIMEMGIRPGSETDTGAKVKAYGATTLEGRHVVEEDHQLFLRFTGKKGVSINLPVTDPISAAILLERKKRAGENGQLFNVNEKQLLAHVHSFDGGSFKTKDFRTLLASRTALAEMANHPAPKDQKDYQKKVLAVAKVVSSKLGNTPIIALQSYINPLVFAPWKIHEEPGGATADADFEESKHPRGQPGNAGQFASTPGGSSTPAKHAAPTNQAAANRGADNLKSYLRMVAEMHGPGQPNVPNFLLKNGRTFRVTEKTYEGKRKTAKLCYMNATQAALSDPDLTYVEGYITVHGVPIQHAWNVNKAGDVIDPTITKSEHVSGYFGVPFNHDYLARAALKNKVYGLLGHASMKTLEPLLKGEAGNFSPEQAIGPLATPATFRANHYAGQYNDPSITPKKILENFPKDTAKKMAAIMDKIDAGTQTQDLYKKDGKYTPERRAVHDHIIQELMSPEKIAAATPPHGEKPTFTMLGGRGGSGKSWFTGKNGFLDPAKNIVLDADEIKKRLPEYDGWNATLLHEESSDVFEALTDVASSLGLNIVHDVTMKTGAKAERIFDEFHRRGYRTEAHYMYAPPQEAATRAVERFLNPKEGRFVPPGVVLHNLSNEHSFDMVKDKVDKWSFYDNREGTGGPKLVMESS